MFSKIKNFLFKNTSDKQTVIKNTFWLGLGEAGTRVLKLGLFVYAARILGATEWGLFSYGLSLMGIFSILSDIGINSILIKQVSKKDGDIKKYIATSFVLKIILSIVSMSTLLMLSIFIENEQVKNIIPLVAVLLMLDNLREFGFSLNRAREKMEHEAIIKILSTILLVSISLYYIFKTPTAPSLFIAYIIAGILGVILVYISTKKYFPNIFLNYDPKIIKNIFKEAWPVGMVAILGIALYNIDTLILGYFREMSEVGYYSAAQKIIQILWLVPSLFATALLPMLSRTSEENIYSFKKVLGKSITISILGIGIISGVLAFFATPLISIIYGTEYTPAVPVFQIASISAVAIIPSLFISNAFLAKGKQKITLKYIIIASGTNVFLCFALIPPYGMYGAAIAYTLSQIISNVFIFYKAQKDPETKFNLELPSIENLFFKKRL